MTPRQRAWGSTTLSTPREKKVEPEKDTDFEDWEDYYTAFNENDTYDWLLDWSELKEHLEPFAEQEPRSVLHLGCGNSKMPEEMYDAGFQMQTCVDISKTVIAHNKSRNLESRGAMQWIAADCTDLNEVLPSDSFALVVDKGTLDVFLQHDKHALMVTKFLREAFRVTHPAGVYVSINLATPGRVLCWLKHKAFGWNVEVIKLKSDKPQKNSKLAGRIFYGYICRKQCPAEQSLKYWPQLQERVLERPSSDLSSEEEDEDEDEDSDDDDEDADSEKEKSDMVQKLLRS